MTFNEGPLVKDQSSHLVYPFFSLVKTSEDQTGEDQSSHLAYLIIYGSQHYYAKSNKPVQIWAQLLVEVDGNEKHPCCTSLCSFRCRINT